MPLSHIYPGRCFDIAGGGCRCLAQNIRFYQLNDRFPFSYFCLNMFAILCAVTDTLGAMQVALSRVLTVTDSESRTDYSIRFALFLGRGFKASARAEPERDAEPRVWFCGGDVVWT
jgi:hypothetical protein